MNRSRRDPRRAVLSAGLSLLMLTLSVAVPVLEQDALFGLPIVENEHSPGDCPSGHDHTVCTQVGANLALDSDRAESPLASSAVTVSPVMGTWAWVTTADDEANPPRAPPLA